MNTPRAIAIVFNGGEVSEKTLRKIQQMLAMDDSSNANGVRTATYDALDIANFSVNGLICATNIEENFDEDETGRTVEIRLHNQSLLDQYANFIVSMYGDSCRYTRNIPVIQMTVDYIHDNRVKIAFDAISKIDDDTLFQSEAMNKYQISKAFVKYLRRIVKSFQNVSR